MNRDNQSLTCDSRSVSINESILLTNTYLSGEESCAYPLVHSPSVARQSSHRRIVAIKHWFIYNRVELLFYAAVLS